MFVVVIQLLGNIMKQTLVILIIFTFLSCNNVNKNNIPASEIHESENQLDQKKEYQPIFLNLSPKMDDLQFEEKLTSSSPNKKITIPINNYSFEFNIKKSSNKIVLEYNDIKTLIFTNKFGDNAEKRYLDFIKKEPLEEELIESFINLFKNKYSRQIKQLPISKNLNGEYYNNQIRPWSERDLFNYGFKEENYLIFQDSIKTVLIGYTNAENPRKLDRKALDLITYSLEISNKESDNRESIKSKDLYDLAIDYKKELEKLSPYQQALKNTDFEEQISKSKGISLEINYMHNSDFEFLKNKIYKANKEFNDKLKQKDSLLKIKKNKENRNLNEI